jgi:hypothetical protein
MKPAPAKPVIIIAHVEGSGTVRPDLIVKTTKWFKIRSRSINGGRRLLVLEGRSRPELIRPKAALPVRAPKHLATSGNSLCRRGDKTMRPLVGGLIARASFSAALRQAAGGWRPAPLHSLPKGRRPFRESPRRHPDPWWPLQTSKRLPLVPLDIFYPAQSGSPLLRVTIRCSRCDYALQRNPFRRKSTKVNVSARLCPGGHATGRGVSSRPGVCRFPCG